MSKQKAILRRKIYDHKNSMTHIRAEEIVEESKKERLKEGFREQHKGQFETTERPLPQHSGQRPCKVRQQSYSI